MARIKTTRKARFQSALALTGLTQETWAAQHGDVSRVQLNLVLNGKRTSGVLIEKVDAFISEVAQKVMAGAA